MTRFRAADMEFVCFELMSRLRCMQLFSSCYKPTVSPAGVDASKGSEIE